MIGTRFDSRRNKTTGTFDQVVVTDKYAYIPILETLKSILQNPHLTDLFKARHVPKEGVYVDLSDAAHFKSNPYFAQKKMPYKFSYFTMISRLLIHWVPKKVYTNWVLSILH